MRRRGSTSLEFGLVMPAVLLTLVVGMNWGWYLFQQLTVLIAAQRGTRMAAGASTARLPKELAEQAARDWLSAYGLPGEDADVTISIDPDGGSEAITVRVALPCHPPISLGLLPGQVDATATGVYYGWMLDPTY